MLSYFVGYIDLVRCVLELRCGMAVTHIEPDQCNPRNNSTHKSQAPDDGCMNIQNMSSII